MKLKKVFLTIMILVVLIIFYFIINHFFVINKSKNEVDNYLTYTYDFEYKLIKYERGKSAYPAERMDDTFILYDITNKFYFILYNGVQGIRDYYYESYYGNLISTDIIKQYPIENDDYYIRCWDDKDLDYLGANCQLFYFSDTNDITKLYNIINYLQTQYEGINILVIVSEKEFYNDYKKLFEYNKIVALRDMPNKYYKEINTNENVFYNINDFYQFLIS